MQPRFRKRIIDRQRDALTRYGRGPGALCWSSRSVQEIRFRWLAAIGIADGDSLLDVGCGFGDLDSWLRRHGIETDYTGIDLSPDLISECRKMHQGLAFFCGDLFEMDFLPAAFDWVVASGTFAEALNDDGAYARHVIARMYALCRRGVAFNMLDVRHAWTASRWDLQSFQPLEILEFCHRLCPDSSLRDGYLVNDFTIYMHKPGAADR